MSVLGTKCKARQQPGISTGHPSLASARFQVLQPTSSPRQTMSSAQTELHRLLSLPLVDLDSRNALAVLYAQCEAPSLFARFAVEHIARRARSALYSYIQKLLDECTCSDCRAYAQERPDLDFRRGPRPDTEHELEVPEQAVFESEAVNDEAKRWICDFLLFRAYLVFPYCPLFVVSGGMWAAADTGSWCVA
jgi:hypothetical protein